MPVLMDFGIASRFGGEVSRDALDVAGKISGTVAYMAPEQARGDLVDARADLYSLGCMLYELVTGRPPFVDSSPVEVLLHHIESQPLAPSSLVKGLAPELDALILGLLAKEPHRRLEHADAVADALGRFGAQAAPMAEAPRPRAYLYRTRFVGRDVAMQELLAQLDAAQEGQGGLVLVGGESGVGKTRLATELTRLAHGRDIQTVVAECLPEGKAEGLSPSSTGTPLAGLRQVLQAIADRCQERGARETDRLLGPRARVLAPYEPALAGLLDQSWYPEPAELPAEEARLRLFYALAAASVSKTFPWACVSGFSERTLAEPFGMANGEWRAASWLPARSLRRNRGGFWPTRFGR